MCRCQVRESEKEAVSPDSLNYHPKRNYHSIFTHFILAYLFLLLIISWDFSTFIRLPTFSSSLLLRCHTFFFSFSSFCSLVAAFPGIFTPFWTVLPPFASFFGVLFSFLYLTCWHEFISDLYAVYDVHRMSTSSQQWKWDSTSRGLNHQSRPAVTNTKEGRLDVNKERMSSCLKRQIVGANRAQAGKERNRQHITLANPCLLCPNFMPAKFKW